MYLCMYAYVRKYIHVHMFRLLDRGQPVED